MPFDDEQPFSPAQFTANQAIVMGRMADLIIADLSAKVRQASITFLFEGPITHRDDKWVNLTPHVRRLVTTAFLDVGWDEVAYDSALGEFTLRLPTPSPEHPTRPDEYDDSSKFTEDFETVKEIIHSERWHRYVEYQGSTTLRIALELCDVFTKFEDRFDTIDRT